MRKKLIDQFEKNLSSDKFAIAEAFYAFLNFFYFERYIKHNNIFGKNNNKGVEYKKKYFNIIFDLDLILGYFFNYKINGCEILNEILRSLSSLVLYISGYTI